MPITRFPSAYDALCHAGQHESDTGSDTVAVIEHGSDTVYYTLRRYEADKWASHDGCTSFPALLKRDHIVAWHVPEQAAFEAI